MTFSGRRQMPSKSKLAKTAGWTRNLEFFTIGTKDRAPSKVNTARVSRNTVRSFQ